jgi:acetyl esterase/lipase
MPSLMKKSPLILEVLGLLFATAWLTSSCFAEDPSSPALCDYSSELNIPYCVVDGKTETLNAFLPPNTDKPSPAMVEIHGGWFTGGGPETAMEKVPEWRTFTSRKIAFFSITYRLGKEGGFPQNIRDCRNAIRFLRKNAARFHIDPDRIGCMGGSAGGHLSLMVAMVPEDFDDGGPTEDLKGVSAAVCNAFAWIPPTDFVRFWNQGPEDVVTRPDGRVSFRDPDPNIPNDARPHLRLLFHGVVPDTVEHKALYDCLSPIGQVRKEVPPLLICDGEKDPIVPGLEGRELWEKLHGMGADATYWMTPGGGHAFPGGTGFSHLLEMFLDRTLMGSNR